MNAAAAAASASGSARWSGSWAMTAAPDPVQVALGRSDESATEIVDGSLRAGQQVIVGTAAAPQDDSWFGISWRL